MTYDPVYSTIQTLQFSLWPFYISHARVSTSIDLAPGVLEVGENCHLTSIIKAILCLV